MLKYKPKNEACMNIALDYDGTFTNDPSMWLRFVADAQRQGHSVYVVTMRYPSECDGTRGAILDPRLKSLSVPVVCTSRMAKRPVCEALGIRIHIWIDDNPEAVHWDASMIWETPSPEGNVIDPVHG